MTGDSPVTGLYTIKIDLIRFNPFISDSIVKVKAYVTSIVLLFMSEG